LARAGGDARQISENGLEIGQTPGTASVPSRQRENVTSALLLKRVIFAG